MWIALIAAALAGELDPLAVADPVACNTLGAADDALYAHLVELAQPDVTPAVVPMRAAQCLLEVFGEHAGLDGVVLPWMRSPSTYGFALLVASRADSLPTTLAVAAVNAAREMPDPGLRTKLLRRFGRSGVGAVRGAAADG
jgi:hypothetical protein